MLTLLLCFSHCASGDGLPDLGDVSQAAINPIQERQIGQQSMMQIRASKQYLNDAEINEYLNQTGNKLVEFCNEPSLEFEFFAVNDYSVNAFALPGGFVGVNAGLLLITESESELASVLAHEIAHVTQHHLARMVAAQQGDTMASMAAIAVAILAARSNAQASQAAIAGVQAHAMQKQLDFTREHEQEADRIGFETLLKAGFNTHAMPEFLERLQHATRLIDGNAPNYLRTHPVTSDRIADIENRVSKQPYRLLPDSLDFQLVRTKLIGSQKTAQDAISYFSDALTMHKHGNQIAQQYGLVTALLRNKETERAKEELSVLLKQTTTQNDAMLETLTGKVKHAAGDPDTLDFYHTAVQKFPRHLALIYDYADLLLKSNQAQTAVKLLIEQITLHPTDVTLYDLQAHCYSQLNKPLEQHQAQAYSYAWQGNLHGAMQQLELAKRAGGSFYQLSIIESDLRELRDMMQASAKK
ncbi:MAG: M48 family metalloprotease [Proteobacteria bacterium]|nr:M48 family metalloprotease [Pseudomonadota bacterium]